MKAVKDQTNAERKPENIRDSKINEPHCPSRGD